MKSQMTLTYSMLRSFIACREACRWRYFENLVPLEKDFNLALGSVIHRCLECWHQERDFEKVLVLLDKLLPGQINDPKTKQHWSMAYAMLTGYVSQYPEEGFEVVALEEPFEGKIINPESGFRSRSFVMQGVIDGIVKQNDEYFLLEHKTTSSMDGDYLERLWTDMQISIYWLYAKLPISGVIYNVLVKPKLRQKEGETQEQYELRKKELAKQNKNGKSNARRRMPETDEEYLDRLIAKCSEPGMYHREVLYLSSDQLDQTKYDLWTLSKQLLDAQRNGGFYRNTAHCFHYQKPCAYLPLCASNGDEMVMENLYERIERHPELKKPIDYSLLMKSTDNPKQTGAM